MNDIDYRLVDNVAWIMMNRPEVLNALSKSMFRNLRRALAGATGDGRVDFIVIKGTGSAFSAGLDIKEVGGFKSKAEAKKFVYDLVKPFWDQLFDCDKPIISAVNGPAYGAGAEITLASDIVVASTKATIAFSGGRVGALCCISPIVGPLLANGRAVVEMNLTGRPVSAKEAQQMGLVNYVVPLAELDSATNRVVRSLLNVSPISNASFKRILKAAIPRRLLDTAYEQLFRTITSPDFRKGSASFVAKRPPAYYR